MNKLPEHFVYLEEIDNSIVQDIKYATSDNILGRPVTGYEAPRCIITQQVAELLSLIHKKLALQSLGLKVFDCYRPQMAVDDFYAWSQDPHDQKTKSKYFPRINKADLFRLGYFIEKSGHTRGSTVDLTLINLKDNSELEMGTPFDFMDERSYPTDTTISDKHYQNRMILRNIMLEHHFVPIPTEWWHYTYRDEPYKDTYFNFPVR